MKVGKICMNVWKIFGGKNLTRSEKRKNKRIVSKFQTRERRMIPFDPIEEKKNQ